MARPHKLLREYISQQDMTCEMLAEEIGIGKSTMSQKMNSHLHWTVDEMWKIMDTLCIPANEMHKVFPRNGQNEPAVKRRVFRRAV